MGAATAHKKSVQVKVPLEPQLKCFTSLTEHTHRTVF